MKLVGESTVHGRERPPRPTGSHFFGSFCSLGKKKREGPSLKITFPLPSALPSLFLLLQRCCGVPYGRGDPSLLGVGGDAVYFHSPFVQYALEVNILNSSVLDVPRHSYLLTFVPSSSSEFLYPPLLFSAFQSFLLSQRAERRREM